MSSSMNSQEGHAISFLDVSSDLSVKEVWSPFRGHVPSQLVDPGERSVGWYCTIGISGVEEDSVLVSKSFIDPLGSILTFGIVNSVSAEVPCLNGVRNMELISNSLEIQILNNGDTKGTGGKFLQFLWVSISIDPWGVVLSCEGLLVGFKFITDLSKTDFFGFVKLELI